MRIYRLYVRTIHSILSEEMEISVKNHTDVLISHKFISELAICAAGITK